MENQLRYLGFGEAKYRGAADDYVRFTMDHQLMDAATWRSFVEVFRHDSDVEDRGWRCEYWGKMMRGAALTYMYNGDEALYAVLEETVRDLLTAQREDGRFSTYASDYQLCGWDLWGRKYILTGCMHFLKICRDDKLRADILEALCRHADCVVNTVGEGAGKVDITKTSSHWLGVNSCSILEPMIELYTLTGKQSYMDFAEYIISTGGCSGGNLIELAIENKIMPYMYPENKAYETISFFEGILAYYEVTGKEKYLDAVLKFVEAVNDSDITVIGCSGCTHELFDNSIVKQIEFSHIIMQETCVTVTWMRMVGRLHLLTGDKKYIDRMECSAYNALYGSANTRMLKQKDLTKKIYLDPLPFDSYSPLYNNKRGLGIGGLKRFAFGGHYGCCACIAAAGIALFPLCSTLVGADGITVNSLQSGRIETKTPAGKRLGLIMETTYPKFADYTLTVNPEEPECFAIRLRLPDFFEGTVISVNGEMTDFAVTDGYATLTRTWQAGDTVTLSATMTLRTEKVGNRTAFLYGPLVMARDSAKEGSIVDLEETLTLATASGAPVWKLAEEKTGELVRIIVTLENGGELMLSDYASCGKGWLDDNCLMTVWMNIEE